MCRHPRTFWIVLFGFLLGLLLQPTVLTAQDVALPVAAATLNGAISVRLPEGWMSRDAAAPVFTDVLVFGDNAESLQNVVDALRGAATQSVGRNGTIGAVAPQLVAGLPQELAVSTMVNAMISDIQTSGGRVLEQQSLLIGGLYPGTIAVVTVPTAGAKGLIGAFAANATIVEFSIGAAPESVFDAERALFFSIMNSIRLPAEAATVVQPTAAPVPTLPSNTAQAEVAQSVDGSLVVRSGQGLFSLRLTNGWTHEAMSIPGFTDVIAFGSQPETMQAIVALATESAEIAQFSGIGGLIGAVDPSQLAGQPADSMVSSLMQELVTSIAGPGVDVLHSPEATTFGGQFAGELVMVNIGYVAVFQAGDRVLVALLVTDDLPANQAAMRTTLDSIRVPAENASTANTVQAAATLAPAGAEIIHSSDGQLSLQVPASWTVIDRIEGEAVLAYGDSEQAAQSRLASARPDLVESVPVQGNGGLVILYPMERFGIDPAAPDLSALMQQALAGLQGYSIDAAPAPLAGHESALVATIAGTEHGFLALIPFGEQIAYVTATGTQDSFAGAQAVLAAVVASVQVPAQAEDTGGSGLGGLSGLLESATPTPVGLGGL